MSKVTRVHTHRGGRRVRRSDVACTPTMQALVAEVAAPALTQHVLPDRMSRATGVAGRLVKHVRGWTYQAEDGRDLRIDLLRGVAVLAMVVDHLAGPSKLYLVTGGNRFYTSAAEGFICLSGLTVGLVYRRIAQEKGFLAAANQLVARAWTLYALAVGLTLVMLPASETLHLPWARGLGTATPIQVVWAILSLHQTYYLVDVLALYVLLMLAAPLALLLLCEGRTWILLLLSSLIWAGFQVFPDQTDVSWSIAGNYLFYLSSWQAPFFIAMALGYHRERIAQAVRPPRRGLLFVAVSLMFVGLVLLYSAQDAVVHAWQPWLSRLPGGGTWSTTDIDTALFAKGLVRPGRVLASAVVFTFLFLSTTLLWVPVRRALGWLLLPLGQNALYAYSSHVALALVLGLAVSNLGLRETHEVLNAGIQVLAVGLVWLAIKYRVLYPSRRRRGRWEASIVPLSLVACVALQLQPVSLSVDVAAAAQPSAESDATRLARAFGTPAPRTTAGVPGSRTPLGAAAAGTPAPSTASRANAPGPTVPAPLVVGANEGTAAEYVGNIGGTFRELWFYSASLGRDMSYYVYLPPGYGTDPRRFPVLYMLHGAGGSKDEWPAYGLVNDVDQSIRLGEITPLVVVMPQGDVGYWVNWPDGGPAWGDYVSHDLRRQVDATFRTSADPAHRAIGGLSMGAAGALQLAFNHPEQFGVVGGHSPSLHLDDGTFTAVYGTGTDFAHREPIDLATAAPGLQTLRIWIDAGEDDPWLGRDEALHLNLLERGIQHDWAVLPGGHDGDYWINNIPRYLRFYDQAFTWLVAE